MAIDAPVPPVARGDLFPKVRRTPLPGGYMGKLLRVDLTAGTCEPIELPEEPILRKFWGGQALGSYILLNELGPDVDAYSPESMITMMTGPVTGTGLTPGGTKMTAVYVSPATRNTLGRGATSGFWGVTLKAAGYDGLIITGKSERPVYLYIDEGKAEIRDARSVWGKGTRDTEDMLRRQVGRQDARVACIGPAGENLIRAAMLVNDYNHVAAHGLGAVMGSKKLKAIVVRGTRRPQIVNKEALIDAGQRWRGTLRTFDIKSRQGVGHGGAWGAITRHNWRATTVEDHARGFDKNRITPRPCFQCQRMCPWDADLHGEREGQTVHFNAGSEWLDTFFNLDIKGNDVL